MTDSPDPPRLTTEFRVQALIRRGMTLNVPVMLVRRGYATAGAILIKVNRFKDGVRVLAQTRSKEGHPAWYPGTGPSAVEESVADAYIERARERDPDLWVVEVEDPGGRLTLDEPILD